MKPSCMDCGTECSYQSKRCAACQQTFIRRPIEPPSLEELLANTSPSPIGCLLWSGALDGRGYGNVGRSRHYGSERKNWIVHRLVYELAVGTIPAGSDLHHICEVKRCVNPAHLEPVTRKQHHGNGGRHPEHTRRMIEASIAARRHQSEANHRFNTSLPR